MTTFKAGDIITGNSYSDYRYSITTSNSILLVLDTEEEEREERMQVLLLFSNKKKINKNELEETKTLFRMKYNTPEGVKELMQTKTDFTKKVMHSKSYRVYVRDDDENIMFESFNILPLLLPPPKRTNFLNDLPII